MSHKSEAKYSNITKDRLIYNKTGHFAILVNRRGVCKIFENGGVTGADPGFRRGGGFIHSEGGVSYRNFRSGSKLLQGPGQINKQKKLQTAVGGGVTRKNRGGPITRKKTPVSAPGPSIELHRPKSGPKYIWWWWWWCMGGGAFWFIKYIKFPCFHLITRGGAPAGGGGPALRPMCCLDII